MRAADFDYLLPETLIAQRPPAERRASRLLVLGGDGAVADRRFADLPALLRAGDLLVLNDTRVIPARLYARKHSGGRVEMLIERTLAAGNVLAHARASKPLREGAKLLLDNDAVVTVRGRDGDLFRLDFGSDDALAAALIACGHVPLPPYIDRADEAVDVERYQTVYARRPGAVAAPTAGLHLDEAMLEELAAAGVECAWVTLHVGAGTFQPVRAENIEDHHMHAERVVVPAETVSAIANTQARGGRVVAVGTTVVRSLESAAAAAGNAPLAAWVGDTRLFIYPGFRFRVVDAMVTNFHLPQSTLLMLVCAFAGQEPVLVAYRHAVDAGYRFFSYGDAMFVNAAGDAG